MKVVVIGGSGHIGTYLVPKLVRDDHQVIMVSRGKSEPYTRDWAWDQAEHVMLDRTKDPAFNRKIAEMNADIVIDLICFKLDEVKEMVKALKETDLSHYLYCSTIWTHGRTEAIPVDPHREKHPLDDYGRQKYESEKYLLHEFRVNGFPATMISPGQICGPGWSIINPLGYGDDSVFQTIADGEEIRLPNLGMETLHPVHAEDVAQLFVDAMNHRTQALGENFYAVSEDSLTLYGYAMAMYRFSGQEPKVSFLSWDKWCDHVADEKQTNVAYLHLARSGHFSMEKAKRLLEFQSRYTAVQVVEASMQSYIERGIVTIEK
ncbi:Nucleoside-diphosphate-sugar epimerase [Alkalibacterium subtropicum]|uniref:UDP-glucose 4-epimerase n=1 Tax=Alkalibacterium subtropicum TaxID=753702 RepID=A0A1I1FY39_9LACT|nr:NAD-dependent epimerase/dehydratase family protein [Alkalibacterium subtropicum]SFC01953.1 Nucleoside-diphosphate-sugar epimerase [Alkalibacterium subtropicum]